MEGGGRERHWGGAGAGVGGAFTLASNSKANEKKSLEFG